MKPETYQRLLILFLLASGIALGGSWWLAQAPAGAGAAAAAGGTLVAPLSPQALMAVRLPGPDGKSHTLAEWRGRPLVINFWATWCDPCRAELPLLSAAAARPEFQAATVIGIAIDDSASVQDFLKNHPLGYPVLVDTDSVGQTLASQLGNFDGALPFTALIDRQGTLVETRRGVWKAGELEQRLKRLIGS